MCDNCRRINGEAPEVTSTPVDMRAAIQLMGSPAFLPNGMYTLPDGTVVGLIHKEDGYLLMADLWDSFVPYVREDGYDMRLAGDPREQL